MLTSSMVECTILENQKTKDVDTSLIGKLSGLLVFASVIPYALRVYQRKITPNITGWSVLTVVGLVLLVNYYESGAKENVWPAVAIFINALLVTVLAFYHGTIERPDWFDIGCIVLSVIALGLWLLFTKTPISIPHASTLALCVSIFADIVGTIPIFRAAITHPEKDRPFMWLLSALGYGIVVFAITDHTFANYVVPVYMFFALLAIAYPLIVYRIKRRLPAREWI